MTLVVHRVPDRQSLQKILKEHGQDFWLSALANLDVFQLEDRVHTLRVEDNGLAADIFTHCYVFKSTETKTDANRVLDELGMGLRKKRCKARSNGVGCVFAFVNEDEESMLSKQHAALSNTDKRLSAAERVRRSDMTFTTVERKTLKKVAYQQQPNFWVTFYSEIDATQCKNRVITSRIDGELAADRFRSCLLAEVNSGKSVTRKIVERAGLGQRKSEVKAAEKPGCVALLFDAREPVAPVSPPASAASAAASESKKRKRSDGDSNAAVAPPTSAASATASGPKQQKRSDGEGRTTKRERAAALDSVAEKVTETSSKGQHAADDEGFCKGEQRYERVRVLESRLLVLLPALRDQRLTTCIVQQWLEFQMDKKPGTLDKFRTDIGRIWRAHRDEREPGREARLRENDLF
jgi:hypothetical protein